MLEEYMMPSFPVIFTNIHKSLEWKLLEIRRNEIVYN